MCEAKQQGLGTLTAGVANRATSVNVGIRKIDNGFVMNYYDITQNKFIERFANSITEVRDTFDHVLSELEDTNDNQ